MTFSPSYGRDIMDLNLTRDAHHERNGMDGMAEMLATHRSGWGLERDFYTDPAIFAVEMQRIFRRVWLYAGHHSRIPEPGDYFTVAIGDESLIVVRGHDGTIHAVANVCRHRGSRICVADQGRVKKLVCPYHQWAYELDGKLAAARHMPDGFCREDFPLGRARTSVVEGLIFVCLDDQSPALDPATGRDLQANNVAGAKIAARKTYRVRANWKILLENFLECYHCATVHPEYSRAMAGASTSYMSEAERERDCGIEHALVRSRRQAGDDRPVHFQFRQGFQTQSLDGQPVAPPMADGVEHDGTAWCAWIGYTFEAEINPDHAATFRFLPISADATEIEVGWLVRGSAVEGRDYDCERLMDFWRITGEQDWNISEVTQSGVRSSYYRPGPYSQAEGGAAAFTDWYIRQMREL